MISQIGSAGPLTGSQKQSTDLSVKKSTTGPANDPLSDTLSLNRTSAPAGTYAPDHAASLRQMIVNLFREQGLSARIATGDSIVDFRELTPEQATDLIADDGYFGVEQTSERIVTTAVALAGNDPGNWHRSKQALTKD